MYPAHVPCAASATYPARVLSLGLQPDSEEMGVCRKDKSVLSRMPQPDSGEMGMLQKDKIVLSVMPQLDSGEMGMRGKRQKCALA